MITGLDEPVPGVPFDTGATIVSAEGVSRDIPVIWVDESGKKASVPLDIPRDRLQSRNGACSRTHHGAIQASCFSEYDAATGKWILATEHRIMYRKILYILQRHAERWQRRKANLLLELFRTKIRILCKSQGKYVFPIYP